MLSLSLSLSQFMIDGDRAILLEEEKEGELANWVVEVEQCTLFGLVC